MNYHKVRFLTSFGSAGQLPPSQKPEVVFAGRSNVGKSSLINSLFNQKTLARVSATPGKTATINFFETENLIFADLPGYGYAKVSRGEKRRWAQLMEGYFAQDRDIALVLSLVDSRHPPTQDDQMMVRFLVENELPFVVILTKIDKLSSRQRQERLEAIRGELPWGEQIIFLPFSAQTGEGREELRALLDQLEADLLTEDVEGEDESC
ncbi:MAG: YihA family ribosome biogenesis GTP-binding protein [Angelakisella sp.]|jgi:GTP-binding protein|nr:YihA family ribosome biogenesis GTP-binding protein [Angelakisella sp.]